MHLNACDWLWALKDVERMPDEAQKKQLSWPSVTARQIRENFKLPTQWSWMRQSKGFGFSLEKTESASNNLARSSFIIFVIIPTAVLFFYDALWRTPGYVSETRVAVRAAPEPMAATPDSASIMGKIMGGTSGKTSLQDAYVALNYIRSSAILLDLGARNYMKQYFIRSDIDYFTRLRATPNLEEMGSYWQDRVTASVDTVSGILTVKAEAFRPDEAMRLMQDIVLQTERMINAITLQSRKEAVARAEEEVKNSAQKLAGARERLLTFRNENVILDPGSRATGVNEMLAALMKQKIELETALTTLSGSLNAGSPTQKFQREKLATLDRQIADLKKNLTDSNQNAEAVSSQISGFERLKLEEQFAEKIYIISQGAYQRARQDAEKKQLYLVVIVPPTLPEEATYPKTLSSTLLLGALLGMIWSIAALIVASVNDQRA